MRALWAALTADPAARRRAYSLDGVAEEVLFAVGPLVVAAVLTIASPAAALVLSAFLNLAGALGLATSPAVARHATPAVKREKTAGAARLLGPFQARGFVLLTAAMPGVGLGGGPLEVAVVARTAEVGASAAAGLLLAALSVGSAVGGLLWGRRTHQRSTSAQLAGLVMVAAVGAAAAAGAPTLALLGVALMLTGLVSAPALVVAYLAADDLVPQGGRTEATTWVSTSNNLGAALGAAGAGVVIERGSPGAAIAIGAAVLAATALALMTVGTSLGPKADPPPAEQPAAS